MKPSGETFATTLEEVKGAEAKAASIRAESKAKAEELLKNARKEAEDVKLRAEEETVEMENGLIAEGKKETEKEVGKILEGAKKDSEKIKAKKADAKLLNSLCDEVLKLE
jgi:vacuolar-type H+-ATPase subunit H